MKLYLFIYVWDSVRVCVCGGGGCCVCKTITKEKKAISLLVWDARWKVSREEKEGGMI